MDDMMNATSSWTRLSSDLTELILSRLPLSSLIRASAVCTHWRSLLTDPRSLPLLASPSPSSSSSSAARKPCFFLYGQNNVFLKQNQAFAFDPDSHSWIRIPLSSSDSSCFSGAGGFLLSASPSPTRIRYSPLLSSSDRETSPLTFSRLNPLVGVFSGGAQSCRIVVVGGSRFIGGLVDIEDRLAVEIYDPASDCWEACAPLPPEFSSSHSSQWLISALLGDRFFIVMGIFSNTLSSFDLVHKSWSEVRVLQPPGVIFSFLVAYKDRLILGGLCSSASFKLWEVDRATLEHMREVGSMPRDLMQCLFDDDGGDENEDEDEDEDATKFASLKCVGLDGVVYVFNEDHQEGYPACVCEIGDDDGLARNWRKVPQRKSFLL